MFKTLIFMLFIFVFSTADVFSKEIISHYVPATVLRVVDGDTIVVSAHIWLGVNVETYVRIKGIDTPEIKGKCTLEKDLAVKAKMFVEESLPVGSTVYLHSTEHDKYGGRVVATVANDIYDDIGEELIKRGLAYPYTGKVKKVSWCADT